MRSTPLHLPQPTEQSCPTHPWHYYAVVVVLDRLVSTADAHSGKFIGGNLLLLVYFFDEHFSPTL